MSRDWKPPKAAVDGQKMLYKADKLLVIYDSL